MDGPTGVHHTDSAATLIVLTYDVSPLRHALKGVVYLKTPQ